MTPARPFVARPVEPPELAYCTACASHYWSDLGHVCPQTDPLGVSRGILIGLAIVILGWLLVAAGVIPLRLGWFS